MQYSWWPAAGWPQQTLSALRTTTFLVPTFIIRTDLFLQKMTYSYTETTSNPSRDKAAEYERLKTFFSILASGDKTLYPMAATMLPPRYSERAVQKTCDAQRINPAEPFEDQHVQPLSFPHAPEPVSATETIVPQDFLTTPIVDSNREFTFKMTLHDLYGAENFRELVIAVLAESRETFRPLAEVEARRSEMVRHTDMHRVPQDGSLRLKRATKKRCVGRDKKPGMSQALEWFYEGTETSREYLTSTNQQSRKISGMGLDDHRAQNVDSAHSPNLRSSTSLAVYGAGGSRTQLENDVLVTGKRRLVENYW